MALSAFAADRGSRTSPEGAESARFADVIFAPRNDEDFVPARERQLDHDVRRAAEADQQQPSFLGHFRALQCAEADQAAAEQRRDGFIAQVIGQFIREILRDGGVFGVAAIGVVAGVARGGAKIFASAPAENTSAIHLPQPGDADALADLQSLHAVAELR